MSSPLKTTPRSVYIVVDLQAVRDNNFITSFRFGSGKCVCFQLEEVFAGPVSSGVVSKVSAKGLRAYVDTYLVRGDEAVRRGLIYSEDSVSQSQVETLCEAGMNMILKTPDVLSFSDYQFLYNYGRKNVTLMKPRFVLMVGSATESAAMTSNMAIMTRNLILRGWQVEIVVWDVKNQLNLNRGLLKYISKTTAMDIIHQARISVSDPSVFRSLLEERVTLSSAKVRGPQVHVPTRDTPRSPDTLPSSPGFLRKDSPPFLHKVACTPELGSSSDVSLPFSCLEDPGCDDWSYLSAEIMLLELTSSAPLMREVSKCPIARVPVRYTGKFGPITAPNRTLTWDKLLFRSV